MEYQKIASSPPVSPECDSVSAVRGAVDLAPRRGAVEVHDDLLGLLRGRGLGERGQWKEDGESHEAAE